MTKIRPYSDKVPTEKGFRYLAYGNTPLGANDFWNRNPERRRTYSRKGSKEFDVSYLPVGSSGDITLRKNRR